MSSFSIDHLGQVRAAVECVERFDAQHCTGYYRDNDLQKFALNGTWTTGEKGTLWPLGFDADSKTLFMLANPDGGPLGVYRWDTAKRALGDVVFSSPEFDVEDIVVSQRDHKVVGVRYNDGLRRIHWIDADRARTEREIGALFPGESVAVEFSDDGHRALVFVYSDRNPGEWHLYLPDREELRFLGKAEPWIDPAKMASQRPISFAARDGLKIHGYLTIPAGSDGKNLPLIVNPHGGPFGIRDDWGFDPEAQFLASRGYAVLKVNFRGSSGYGPAFEQAGAGQWGLKMQDDITDGVLWAVAQGIADRNRICIYGASYGGYAALMGLIKTPELYRCGIDYAGVADLVDLYKSGTERLSMHFYYIYNDLDQQRRAWFRRMIGGNLSSTDSLSSRSPVDLVDKIRVPLFIAHGERDPVVGFRHHAWVLKHEIEKRGKPMEWLEMEEEGHGFRKPENVRTFYERMEAFLAKNLVPRTKAEEPSKAH